MISDKKNSSISAPRSKAPEQVSKSPDEFDTKRKMIREKTKAMRVNYVVKDLPIY